MTAEIPFLGCKISLISKCDIRYEGILYSVDAKESTIALSKVRSFGTEDRVTDSGFIPVKDDVYEYIIFRASDVKDLQVNAQEPPGLSDPAIIRSSYEDRPNVAATNASATASSSINVNGSLSATGLSNQQQKPLLPFLPTRTSDQRHQDSSRNIPNMPQISSNSAKGNRSNLVSSILSSGKTSQNAPQGASQGAQHSYASAANQRRRGDRRDSKNDEPRDSRRDDKHREDRRSDGRRVERRDDSRRNDSRRSEVKRDGRRSDDRDGRRLDSRRDHDRDYKPLRDDRRNGDDRAPRSSNRGRYDSSRRYDSYNRRNQTDNKGAYNRHPPMRRHRSGEQMGPLRGRKTDPLKFDKEYDFDKANQEFLELEGKLKDMKLKDEEDKEGDFSGDATSKSTAGASESGSAYDSEENQKDADSKDGLSVSGDFYDKSKSFFDNISCEAVQRSLGKNPKPDWRKERQINAETFGVSSHYRRGGYRGRVHANGYRR